MPYGIPRECAAMREHLEWLLREFDAMAQHGADRAECAENIARSARSLESAARLFAQSKESVA